MNKAAAAGGAVLRAGWHARLILHTIVLWLGLMCCLIPRPLQHQHDMFGCLFEAWGQTNGRGYIWLDNPLCTFDATMGRRPYSVCGDEARCMWNLACTNHNSYTKLFEKSATILANGYARAKEGKSHSRAAVIDTGQQGEQ